MGMNLIYHDEKTKGTIWQGGYQEIPWDLKNAAIHTVIYAAEECPPLSHHLGAELVYCPNDDNMAPFNHPIYLALLFNAMRGVRKTVETVQNGKNILVTCGHGLNRSGLVVGLALRILTDWSPEKIISLIQEKRPNALNNSSFRQMIQTFDPNSKIAP